MSRIPAAVLLLLALGACATDAGGLVDIECTGDCDIAVDAEVFYRVCYPGDGERVCLESYFVKPVPAALTYPAGAPENAALPHGNYRDGVAFLDLEKIYAEHGQDVKVSPDFRLDEIAAGWRCTDPGTSAAMKAKLGCKWAIVQVHTIERLQELRNALGGIEVVSGYRSPGYNAYGGGSGRATYSRHMWGDALDFKPASVSLTAAKKKCEELGAYYINLYSTHIHCDWRHVPVDKRFFGNDLSAMMATVGGSEHDGETEPYSARIESTGGRLTVAHEGFDEGEPIVDWYAFDDAGSLLGVYRGPELAPPQGAASVKAVVAGWLETTVEL